MGLKTPIYVSTGNPHCSVYRLDISQSFPQFAGTRQKVIQAIYKLNDAKDDFEVLTISRVYADVDAEGKFHVGSEWKIDYDSLGWTPGNLDDDDEQDQISDDLLGDTASHGEAAKLTPRQGGDRKYYREVTITFNISLNAANEVEAQAKHEAALDFLCFWPKPPAGHLAAESEISMAKMDGPSKLIETFVGDPRPEITSEADVMKAIAKSGGQVNDQTKQ